MEKYSTVVGIDLGDKQSWYKITKEQMQQINIQDKADLPKWNYTITPA